MIAPLHALSLGWTAIGAAAAIASVPGTMELLLVTAGNVLPAHNALMQSSAGEGRLAVVIPAHNEENNVASSITSVLRAEHPFAEVAVVVVADNCTDMTAEVALCEGARVLVRDDAAHRGKGYALDHAFRLLMQEGFDAFLVVDADTKVAANFLEVAGGALIAGADAIQVPYLVRNPEASMRTRLMKVALLAFNAARPRGRDHLGLSCGLLGNGFGLRRETLAAIPYTAVSLVEDLEYHLLLIQSGRRVRFLDETAVFGEIPEAGQGVTTQRTRWEGGRFHMLRMHALPLTGQVLRGRWTCFEPLLELLLLPLALHATLLLLACTGPWLPGRVLGLAGAVIACAHLVEAIVLGGTLKDAASLALAPFYVLWKLLLVPALVRSSRGNMEWIRTERTAVKRVP